MLVLSLDVWFTFSATFLMTRIFPATFDMLTRTFYTVKLRIIANPGK